MLGTEVLHLSLREVGVDLGKEGDLLLAASRSLQVLALPAH